MKKPEIERQEQEEEVFRIIRSGDIALWLGAGMSKYAGYLTGGGFSKKLHQKLPRNHRNGLRSTDLQRVSQAFMNYYNREQILDILKEEFINKEPVSIKYHEVLSRIPQIRTIITTNYDTLLERVYQNDGQVICNEDHVISTDPGKVGLYKIHGDVSFPETIILTEEDYVSFFDRKNDQSIWSVISERIATRNQVLLGYGFEDINIKTLFRKVRGKRKPIFFIAPNLSDRKILELKNQGIQYINSDAEGFIERLYSNVKRNILNDLDNKMITLEFVNKFLSYEELDAEIVFRSDRFLITSINSKGGKVESVLNLGIKGDSNFFKNFNDFVEGRKIGRLEIPQSNLSNFTFSIKDILLPSGDVGALLMEHYPAHQLMVDIKFLGDGYERLNIPVKVFVTDYLVQIQIDLERGKLKIEFDKSSTKKSSNFEFERLDHFGKTSEELGFYTILLRVFSGDDFKIYIKDNKDFKMSIKPDKKNESFFGWYKEYFEALKIIEDSYGVRFNNIPVHEINSKSDEKVFILKHLIENGFVEATSKGPLKIEFSELSSDIIKYLESQDESQGIIVDEHNLDKMTIHEQEIILGYPRLQFMGLELKNKDELLAGKTLTAILDSENHRCIKSYLKESTRE